MIRTFNGKVTYNLSRSENSDFIYNTGIRLHMYNISAGIFFIFNFRSSSFCRQIRVFQILYFLMFVQILYLQQSWGLRASSPPTRRTSLQLHESTVINALSPSGISTDLIQTRLTNRRVERALEFSMMKLRPLLCLASQLARSSSLELLGRPFLLLLFLHLRDITGTSEKYLF